MNPCKKGAGRIRSSPFSLFPPHPACLSVAPLEPELNTIMNRHKLLDTALIPGNGGELRLFEAGDDFVMAAI
ncbi:MAG: hypothetical protein K0S16_2169 [Moraxellaceae bacterium]|nr:hypothetical protein [Moraxellaceae bacterium]